MHAGSPAEALRRLETLALMAGVGLPHAAIREQVADALDLVVHQERGADGARRVVAVERGRPRRRADPACASSTTTARGRPVWRPAAAGGPAASLLGAGRPAPC